MRTLLLTLLLTPLGLAASPLPDYPFVYAFGLASREVPPDRATIRFRIKAYDAQPDQAYHLQSQSADAILTFAGKLGVPNEAIVAQAIDKTAVRKEDDKGKELEIIGYETDRSVQVELGDLAAFPKLIEFLYVQPFVEGITVTFGRKDEAGILESLTDEACIAAKDRATRLSKGFGKTPKLVRAISENGFEGIPGVFGIKDRLSYSIGMADANGGKNFRAIPSSVSFHKVVHAIYEIE